jgi:hypothetical protein
VRDVQSGPPLGPSRSNGSEAGCRLPSGIRRRSKCPPPRFVRVGGAAGRRRRPVPDSDSRRVGVADPSCSTRARRGSVDVSVVMLWGDLFGSKRRSKPSEMSDRSASLRTCSTTASGRDSFPGPPDPRDRLKHAPRSVPPIAPARAAGQTTSSAKRSDEVTHNNRSGVSVSAGAAIVRSRDSV